jgi:hypothetical protein
LIFTEVELREANEKYRRWKEPAESHQRRNRIRWRHFLRG